MINNIFICPVCGEGLTVEGTVLACGNGHRFDLSSAGYVNLLRPGKMRNRSSGDDKGMVMARTRFLSAGYYKPNKDAIISAIDELLPKGGVVLDAGCGEGYYTNGIAEVLPGVTVVGIDASKHATEAAAKAARRLGVTERTAYATASLAAMPFPDKSVDLILSFFSPCDYVEFARVLKDGGKVLIGSAGKSHLYELKEVLYGKGNVRDNEKFLHGERAHGSGLVFESEKTIKYRSCIAGGDHINALFSMTPYYWRTPRSGADALTLLRELNVTVEVDLTVLSLSR